MRGKVNVALGTQIGEQCRVAGSVATERPVLADGDTRQLRNEPAEVVKEIDRLLLHEIDGKGLKDASVYTHLLKVAQLLFH